MTIQTTARNADLGDLLGLLRDQHARKLDVVAPATAIRAVNGRLTVTGTDPLITEDGVTSSDGTYVPTAVCDEGLASKLDVPVGYLKRLRETRPDLYDYNVNGWLHGANARGHWGDGQQATTSSASTEWVEDVPAVPADSRSFLVRAFRGDEPGDVGIARAFLSDRYGVIDNLDVLMAALDGVRDAGVAVEIRGGDLTDRRMVVRLTCPEVTALAPTLLRGYRSPFTGQTGEDNPVIWAGFQISNSETGGGAFTITPRLEVQVCKNGMTITKEALSKVHLGGRLDAGVVRWGQDTQEAAVTLVQKQTRDAVQTFLSPDYLTGVIGRLEEKAGETVDNHDAVRTLAKSLRYTDEQADGILGYFTQGGQMTLGGVVNAVTAYAQTVEDGDTAYDLEARAVSLLGV